MITTQRKVHKERLTEFLPPRGCPRSREANRRWCRLFLVGVWATAGCAALAQDDGGPVRYEIKHVAQHDRLPGVTAAVEVKSWEPDVKKGIELLLDISNDGADAVDLYDPMDNTFVYLKNFALDPSGASVSLPVDGVGMQAARHNRDPERRARAIDEIKARGPFHIVKDEPRRRVRNVKGVDDVEGEEYGLVRLEPGEQFQARVRLTQIMAEPQKYWAAREKPRRQVPPGDRTPLPPEPIPPPKAIPIPAGTYQLNVMIVLTTPATVGLEGGDSARTTINMDPPITIQLGPKPEPGE